VIRPPEDTEKQSAPVTQLTLKQRETISTVQGHLEGYASMAAIQLAPYESHGDYEAPVAALKKLIPALREDAEKLKQSGGGED
jgi:hypothetical protein